MRILLASLAVALMVTSAPASAAWNVAESKHFVIYADERSDKLSAFASRLERFDKAARYLRGMDDPPIGMGNRLTVFVLPTVTAVSKLAGNKYIEGFYSGRVTGSAAFVPRTANEDDPLGLSADTIFFHEYSHHLMFQAIDRPMPEWVTEGFAEFMSTVRFEKNGDIGHRPAREPSRLGAVRGNDAAARADAERVLFKAHARAARIHLWSWLAPDPLPHVRKITRRPA